MQWAQRRAIRAVCFFSLAAKSKCLSVRSAHNHENIPIPQHVAAKNQAKIVSAKQVVNKYFSALDRGDFTEAYEQMSRSSDRGTSSEFAEENANIETITVNFTQNASVSYDTNGATIELPIRYSIKTKNDNTETYSGSAIIYTDDKDAEYEIIKIDVTREEN